MIESNYLDVAQGNLYVIVAHKFNHIERPAPIDPRLFHASLNAHFYFVDDDGVPPQFEGRGLAECLINPSIVAAGKAHLAEWTFLLTELERPFANYPFFVVSSRFHEKNTRLSNGILEIWPMALEGLRQLGWAYLPSYDRDPNFQDFSEYRSLGRLGMCDAGLAYIDGFWGVQIPEQYALMSDFFCNYIGFQSREHFEFYMGFYLPFIRRFFHEDWTLRRDPELYVRRRNVFRQEKPFSLLIEMVSHMFFYLSNKPFAGVSYNGCFRVDERNASMERLFLHL